jgi:HK97 family phage major capsid protein
MAPGGVLSKIELDGYMATGHLAHMSMRGNLRGLRDLQGQPLFTRTMQEGTAFALDGDPILFDELGSFAATAALMFSGDWRQLVYSIRQDITYKVLTEAVIQDGAGAIVYNLAQQDMVALRVVMRLGWQLPNPMTRLNPTAATRYPFSILLPV